MRHLKTTVANLSNVNDPNSHIILFFRQTVVGDENTEKKNQRDGETMLETYHIKSADGVLSQARKIYDKREQSIVSFFANCHLDGGVISTCPE